MTTTAEMREDIAKTCVIWGVDSCGLYEEAVARLERAIELEEKAGHNYEQCIAPAEVGGGCVCGHDERMNNLRGEE